MMYQFIDQFSRASGIQKEKLKNAYKIESEFHSKIIFESDFEKRQALYADVYSKVHTLYGKGGVNLNARIKQKKKFIWLFGKELKNKSILDIGCGDGALLLALEKWGKAKELCGIDISEIIAESSSKINFIKSNILKFDLAEKFDVVVLDNVYEHICPADTPYLYNSINKVLKPGGKLILLAPNKLFGPWDVTRINDFTYSGNTPANGTHLNETTYKDLLPELEFNGYTNFKSIIPFRRIMYFFKNLRLSSSVFKYLETNSNFLKKFKFGQQSFFRFDVIIIAEKK